MYYIVSVSDMVVKSVSAFPLQTLLLEIYNYSVKFASSTTKFKLEDKCCSIKIYFQLFNTYYLNMETKFSFMYTDVHNISDFLSFNF